MRPTIIAQIDSNQTLALVFHTGGTKLIVYQQKFKKYIQDQLCGSHNI